MILKVTTDIKGPMRSYRLGPKTLICGPSASGKSAIVQAIELALTGTVSDVAGRPLVSDGDTLLALGGGQSLTAEVVYRDKKTTQCKITRGKTVKKGHNGVRPDPKTVLPLRALREMLTGSPEKAQRHILDAVGGKLKLATETWAALSDYPHTDPLELRESLRKVAACRVNIPEFTEEALEKAEDTYAKVERAREFGHLRDAMSRWQEELQQARAVLAELKAEGTGTTADMVRRLHAYRFIHQFHETKGSETCTVCKQPASNLVELAKTYYVNHDKWMNGQREWAEARGKLDTARAVAKDLEGRLKNGEERLIKLAEGLPPLYAEGCTEADADQALAEVQALRNAKRDRERNLAEWQQALRAKDLLKEVDAAIQARVAKSLATVQERLNVVFPGLEVNLNPFRFGVRDGEQLRFGLSGAEWVRALLAWGAALGDEDSILVPEDRAMDENYLIDVMMHIRECPQQVVLTTTLEPSDEMQTCDGWKIINLYE